MRKLNCFIASAFGKTDVDLLYQNAIVIALESLNINALRVDKIIHNDNIDRKIIELIKTSDFGITDLTYSRPSAYFEAGYLEGQNKPVIYMARKDHFIPKAEDLNGNFKIHFDLIAKNIIQWGDVDNQLFVTLKDRISHVTEPIIRKLAEEDIKKNFEKTFNSYPLKERIKILNVASQKIIRDLFKNVEIESKEGGGIKIRTTIHGRPFCIFIIINETIPKRLLKEFCPTGFGQMIFMHYKDTDSKKVIIFVSLKTVSISTLESALDTCKKESDYCYVSTGSGDLIKYLIIDNVKYESQFENKLIELINKLKKNSS